MIFYCIYSYQLLTSKFARRLNVSESDTPAVISSMARKASRKGLGTMLCPVIAAAVRNSFWPIPCARYALGVDTVAYSHKEHLDLNYWSLQDRCSKHALAGCQGRYKPLQLLHRTVQHAKT